MSTKIVTLSGGPGSGKTTALQLIKAGLDARGIKTLHASGSSTSQGLKQAIEKLGADTVLIETEGSKNLKIEAVEKLSIVFPEVFFYVVI